MIHQFFYLKELNNPKNNMVGNRLLILKRQELEGEQILKLNPLLEHQKILL